MGVSIEELHFSVTKFSKSKRGKELFKQWTKSEEPHRGSCYALAEAMRRICGSGELYGFGYDTDDGNRRNTHVMLKVGNLFFDGYGKQTEEEIKKLVEYKQERHDYWLSKGGRDFPVTLNLKPLTESQANAFINSDEFVTAVIEGLYEYITGKKRQR